MAKDYNAKIIREKMLHALSESPTLRVGYSSIDELFGENDFMPVKIDTMTETDYYEDVAKGTSRPFRFERTRALYLPKNHNEGGIVELKQEDKPDGTAEMLVYPGSDSTPNEYNPNVAIYFTDEGDIHLYSYEKMRKISNLDALFSDMFVKKIDVRSKLYSNQY